MNSRCKLLFYKVAASGIFLVAASGALAVDQATGKELQELKQENKSLQKQLSAQQKLIEKLSEKISRMENSELKKTSSEITPAFKPVTTSGKTILSGEGGFAFFKSQSEGPYPNGEFRIDELRLFLDAQAIENVYFFGEINLTTREAGDYFHLGEAYVDFENVSQLWNRDGLLNIRAGRVDIPFGEEYLTRDAIDNPLISHSVADLWGYDEGIEFYGAWGKIDYLLAVLSGGNGGTRDFTADKSIVARLGFAPTKWMHTSVSAMRTGDLDAQNDYVSGIWFGNGYFRSIGSTNATTRYHANLIEGDVQAHWKHGHLKAAGGTAIYDDNDSNASNKRNIYYYYVEAKQNICDKFYLAGRFSQIFANKGYPLVGDGSWDEYFYDELTEELWRLSLGLGYRWNQNLLFKAEYTTNGGRVVGGKQRSHENSFAAEIAFKF